MISSSIKFSLVGAQVRLHHEHVAGAHVLVDFNSDFAIGEASRQSAERQS
jgi:hypothetical protein